MAQYIDKDALVAEIRSRLLPNIIPHGTDYDDWDRGANNKRVNILSFINTLEVEEVDLEKEISEWMTHGDITDTRYDDYCNSDIIETAKYFFELGLKAQKGE